LIAKAARVGRLFRLRSNCVVGWFAKTQLKRLRIELRGRQYRGSDRIGLAMSVCPLSLCCDGFRDMSERITSALLEALNNATEIKERDWASIEEALQSCSNPVDVQQPFAPRTPENRFAATISSGIAKLRSGH
jgi:hypothetical protein